MECGLIIKMRNSEYFSSHEKFGFINKILQANNFQELNGA